MRLIDGRRINHPRAARRWAALVCGAWLGLIVSAHAGNEFTLISGQPTTVPLPGGGWKVIPAAPGSTAEATRVWLGRIIDGATYTEAGVDAAGKAGKLPVKVRETVKVLDAAKAVARCLRRNPVCAAAAVGAAWLIYEKYRTKPDGSGELEHDAGQPQSMQPAYQCGSFYGGTPESACAPEVARFNNVNTSGGSKTVTTHTVQSCSVPDRECTVLYKSESFQDGVKVGGFSYTYGYGFSTTTTLLCPPLVDFYNPVYSAPGGPVGPDGLCPTGRYSRVTPDEAAQRVVAFPPGEGSTGLPEALKEAVAQGETAPSTVATSGPATQTGTPAKTTTTTASGTQTETQTPTYTYHYDGDTITYDTTVSTTTVHNDGSTSTTTTTTEGPKPADDEKDPCVNNPQRVGCMELGSAPGDQVRKRTELLSWAEENIGLPATCPAPRTIVTGSRELVVSYEPTCEAAILAAPWVKAGGALAALFIVLAALRGA